MQHTRAQTARHQAAAATNREELESARAVLATALERATRRRHRRLFEALLATADYRLAVLDRSGDGGG